MDFSTRGNMKHYLFIAILICTICFCATETVSACSCDLPRLGLSIKKQVADARKNAAAVFVGKIVAIRFSDERMGDTPVTRYAKFEVTSLWKGPENRFIEVPTGNICCTCGIKFEEGETWIVYAYSNGKGGFGTSSCTRTSPSTADSKYLRKPKTVKRQ